MVFRVWEGCDVQGWMRHILKQKFIKLKSVLKGWNQEVYGEIETKKNSARVGGEA